MEDDKEVDRLFTEITRIEILAKAHLVEQVKGLATTRDKIAATTAVSMGMAAATIHACVEGYKSSGDKTILNLVLGLFQEAVAPELQRLVNIMKGEK